MDNLDARNWSTKDPKRRYDGPSNTMGARTASKVIMMIALALLVSSSVASVLAMTETTNSLSAGGHPSDGKTALPSLSTKQASCAAPTIQLSGFSVDGKSVSVSGTTSPGGSACTISSTTWNWGDNLPQSTSALPASHIYFNSGTYTITATVHQSDGKTVQASGRVTVAGPNNPPVMINLATWLSNSTNGWPLLSKNLNLVGEITIFNVFPRSNGTFYYNGNYVNVPQVIKAAHTAGVKVALGIGGAASDLAAWPALTATYNTILNNQTLRTRFVDNIASEIYSKGYDAAQWDFENDNGGDFNGTNYALMIGQAREVMPNIEFDCVFAPWMTSISITLLAPYCNQFLYGFPTGTEYSSISLASYANQIGGASKLSVGYDLTLGVKSTQIAQNLTSDKTAGYGAFFFHAGLMTSALYSDIATSFGSATSTTTIWSVTPIISDTRQSITITGSGFGPSPKTTTLPDGSVDTVACNVNTPSLAIQDDGVGTDSWTAGLSGCSGTDGIGIYIVSWTNDRIVLGGFGSELGNSTNPSPNLDIKVGDPLQLLLSGPNNVQVTYSVTVPPLTITSVSPISPDTGQTITITGFDFGPSPQKVTLADGSVDTVACNVNTPSLAIWDNGAGTDSWAAGRNTCTNLDAIGIYIVSWTNDQIVLGGFGSALGNPTHPSANWNIKVGDPLSVVVFGPNNGAEAIYTETATP